MGLNDIGPEPVRQRRTLNCDTPAQFSGFYAYYMVTTPAGAEQPRIRAFLDWIESQVQQDAPVLAE